MLNHHTRTHVPSRRTLTLLIAGFMLPLGVAVTAATAPTPAINFKVDFDQMQPGQPPTTGGAVADGLTKVPTHVQDPTDDISVLVQAGYKDTATGETFGQDNVVVMTDKDKEKGAGLLFYAPKPSTGDTDDDAARADEGQRTGDGQAVHASWDLLIDSEVEGITGNFFPGSLRTHDNERILGVMVHFPDGKLTVVSDQAESKKMAIKKLDVTMPLDEAVHWDVTLDPATGKVTMKMNGKEIYTGSVPKDKAAHVGRLNFSTGTTGIGAAAIDNLLWTG